MVNLILNSLDTTFLMVLFNLLLIVDVVCDTVNEIMSFCLSCHFTQSKFVLIKSFFPRERYNVPTIETEIPSSRFNDLKRKGHTTILIPSESILYLQCDEKTSLKFKY